MVNGPVPHSKSPGDMRESCIKFVPHPQYGGRGFLPGLRAVQGRRRLMTSSLGSVMSSIA